MIEATGEEGDSDDEEKETEPQAAAECPAHKTTIKTQKGTLTDKEVYANAVGFLMAGSNTTSITLACTSYLLALNPDIQEKLQSEIDSYFEDNPVSQSLIITMSRTTTNLKVYQLNFVCMLSSTHPLPLPLPPLPNTRKINKMSKLFQY